MKKILIQLDTDEHPSTFDAIVAHDADVDVLLRYGGIEPDAVKGLVQSAFFTRGPKDLANDGGVGRRLERGRRREGAGRGRGGVLRPVPRVGDARLQRLQHDRGDDGRAARARDRPEGTPRRDRGRGRRRPACGRAADRRGLRGHGVGDPGRRASATSPIAARAAWTSRRSATWRSVEPEDDEELAKVLDGASLVLAAGPAGVELLPESIWRKVDSIEVLADFNAAEPLGIEGTEAQDELEDYDGKRVLGALAIGGPKMKVHKACVRRLFESNDAILDVDGVYEIAKELLT